MEKNLFFVNDFDEKFRAEYQNGNTQPTNPANRFDDRPSEVGKSETTTVAKQLAKSVALPSKAIEPKELTPEELEERLQVFGQDIVDFINVIYPDGAPVGSRHKSALKLASDLMILLDGDERLVKIVL